MRFAPLALVIVLGLPAPSAAASTPPDHVAAVIECYLGWAVEGKELRSDPPKAAPALPHRSCGGQLDPEHLPATIYVSWQLSAEAQHAACNWKYDVAAHRATPLTTASPRDRFLSKSERSSTPCPSATAGSP